MVSTSAAAGEPDEEPEDERSAEIAESDLPSDNVALPSPPAPQTSRASGVETVPRWLIGLLIAATFGSGMAMIVPMSYSLAVQLDQFAPGRTAALGYVLGIGSAATLVVAPLTGVFSDRTRSRWGRRRPFTVLGLLIGAVSVPVMAGAADVFTLTAGWVLSTVGWGTVAGSIGNWQADRLPPHQRGRVSGFTSLTMQIAPVIGILLVGLFRENTLTVFALPASIGLALVLLFVVFAPDPDSRGRPAGEKLTVLGLLRSYGFNPRRAPDFAWNWVGRFVFFCGLTLTTSFTVFFVAQRLDLAVPDVAGVMAIVAASSMVTATVGSLGGGWWSDRMGRRKPFILAGGAVFGSGCAVSAFAQDLTMLLIGTLLNSLGIAIFSAVGQALLFDVLPDREHQAGRYMAIAMFAQKIPGVIAPILGTALLAIGGGLPNFTALYLVAAACAVTGGTIITITVRGAR